MAVKLVREMVLDQMRRTDGNLARINQFRGQNNGHIYEKLRASVFFEKLSPKLCGQKLYGIALSLTIFELKMVCIVLSLCLLLYAHSRKG